MHAPAVGWVLHTWVQSLTHGIMEATARPIYYFGVAVPNGKSGQSIAGMVAKSAEPKK
jgi:hypothetical protein